MHKYSATIQQTLNYFDKFQQIIKEEGEYLMLSNSSNQFIILNSCAIPLTIKENPYKSAVLSEFFKCCKQHYLFNPPKIFLKICQIADNYFKYTRIPSPSSFLKFNFFYTKNDANPVDTLDCYIMNITSMFAHLCNLYFATINYIKTECEFKCPARRLPFPFVLSSLILEDKWTFAKVLEEKVELRSKLAYYGSDIAIIEKAKSFNMKCFYLYKVLPSLPSVSHIYLIEYILVHKKSDNAGTAFLERKSITSIV